MTSSGQRTFSWLSWVLRAARAIQGDTFRGPASARVRAADSQRQPPHASSREEARLDRLTGVVRDSADRGARALACHRTAETHVNAALYELDRLRDEITSVIGRAAAPAGAGGTSAPDHAVPGAEASQARKGPAVKNGIAARVAVSGR